MFRLSNALSTMQIELKSIEIHQFDFLSQKLVFHKNPSVYIRLDFSPKPRNLCCQRFYIQLFELPLLLPKCFMVQKCDISAFKRTFNHVHISLRSGDILDHISNVGLLASLFQRFHMQYVPTGCKQVPRKGHPSQVLKNNT